MLAKVFLGIAAVSATQPGQISSASSAAKLKSLISSISGVEAASSPAPGPVSPAVAAIQRDLTDAAILFDEAMNPYATAEEKSIKSTLRSRGSGYNGASTGASFLQGFEAKIGAGELASLAASIQKSASHHVASGRAAASCGSCSPNFASCPSGFHGSGGVCSPSGSYSGYCNKAFAIGDYSPVELEEAEVFCSFCFPCN